MESSSPRISRRVETRRRRCREDIIKSVKLESQEGLKPTGRGRWSGSAQCVPRISRRVETRDVLSALRHKYAGSRISRRVETETLRPSRGLTRASPARISRRVEMNRLQVLRSGRGSSELLESQEGLKPDIKETSAVRRQEDV